MAQEKRIIFGIVTKKYDLDRIDHGILAELAKNARITNKDLALLVGLSPSRTLERVRALRQRGVIRGYHAEIDPAALGVGIQAMVAIRLRRHSREAVAAFRAHALGLTETMAVYHVAGINDFLIHVATRDADHLRDFALDAFTTRPEVGHVETILIFEAVRRGEMPDWDRQG